MSSKEGEDRKNPVTESNISDEVSLPHPELNTKETRTNTMSCCTETEENRENPLIESNISDEFSLQHPALNTKETQNNTMSSKGETGENRENPVAESNISSEMSLQHPELNTTRTQKNATSSKEETGEDGEKPAIESDASDEVSLQLPDLKSKNSEEGTETNRENPKVEPENKIDNSDQISPRGVLDIPISGGLDSDSSSSSSNNSSKISLKSIAPDGSVLEPQTMQWRNLITGLLLKRNRSMRKLLTFPPAKKSLEISRSSLQRNLRRIQNAEDQMEHRVETIFVHQRPTWRSFDLQELVVATDNFSSENLIGKGGHAEVYKGCLHDGQVVAVKRLTKRNTEEERIRDFLSELGMIAHVNHPNAAQLLGFGVEGGLHLVLQFSPHGSLASVLHGSDEGLQWGIRFKIARGIAEGLLYLHEGCQRRIIHRDIKASNILLTQDYEPQISDFGLAKWLPDKWTHHIVFPIEGTFGYLAPEYFMHGIVNEKTDVFAFGVLLLELITGRRAVDSCRKSLVIWAKPLLEEKNMEELIDPSLRDAYDPTEMGLAVLAASICIHHLSTMRPTMNWVVRLLRGEDASLDLMAREPKIVVRRPPVFDACDTEDYTCSRYLNDLNRYKQLAMEQ